MQYRALLPFALLLGVTPIASHASLFEDDAPKACMPGDGVSFETVFSPSASPSATVVNAIVKAKKSIRIASRLFISRPVSEALVKAGRAGRDVKIIVDGASNATGYSNATFLITMGYAPHITPHDTGLYENFMVIDESDIYVGNIADLADADAEQKSAASLLTIHNAPMLAQAYLANWQTLWDTTTEMKKKK